MELCIGQSISAKDAGNKQRNLKTRKGRWVARLIGHIPIKQVLGPAVRGWWKQSIHRAGLAGPRPGFRGLCLGGR